MFKIRPCNIDVTIYPTLLLGLEVTSTFSPPNNGIDNEADYEPMDSGSSFMPSYPPHQSQDLSIPRQMLTDEEIKENSLLSAGRGIRAPESSEDIAGKYIAMTLQYLKKYRDTPQGESQAPL